LGDAVKLLPILFVLLLSVARAQQYDFPSTRTAYSWTPGTVVGVVGGIPTRTNLVPFAGDNTGGSDVSGALNTAIAAASTNDVILLSAGTYRCDSQLNFSSKRVSLRGAGMNLTTIDCRVGSGNSAIAMGPGVNPDAPSVIVSGLTRGSTQITVVSSASFTVNGLITLSMTNDPSVPVLHVSGYSNQRKFVCTIVSIVGNAINLSQPVPANFSGLSGCIAQSSNVAAAQFQGVEDLTINCLNGSPFAGVYVQGNLVNSWLYRVKILNPYNYGVYGINSGNFEVRRCWVGASAGAGPNHSGIALQIFAYSLFEDNVLLGNQPLIEINQGTTNCVWAYNYLDQAVADFALDTNHNPHNSFNLYEGNITPSIMVDGFFGSTSDDTVFRNWVRAYNLGSPIFSFALGRLTRNYNLGGNIIGTPGQTYGDDGFKIGYPNLGNSSTNGTADWVTTFPYDWDTTLNKPKAWAGQLTTRTSASAGVITLNSGLGSSLQTHFTKSLDGRTGLFYTAVDGTLINNITLVSIVGDVFTFNAADNTLPAALTQVVVVPNPGGFQELDQAVAATLLRKGNYYVFGAQIPPGESLSGQTLANSLFRTSKPASWGTLNWPAYSADAPMTSGQATSAIGWIPAGYFYLNGVWPDENSVRLRSNRFKGSVTVPLN
jgi:hypothetical protein